MTDDTYTEDPNEPCPQCGAPVGWNHSLVLIGRTWRDRVNGNTYHSARAFIDGELAAVAPYQYGYGDQWRYSIGEALRQSHGIVWSEAVDGVTYLGWRVVTHCTDGLKRDAKEWGTDPRTD